MTRTEIKEIAGLIQASTNQLGERLKSVEDALDKDRRTIGSRLEALSQADGEMRREFSAFMAKHDAAKSSEKIEKIEGRLDTLELRNAKQDGGLQVAGWLWGAAGASIMGFLGTVIYWVTRQ